jgi:hypothetical protein
MHRSTAVSAVVAIIAIRAVAFGDEPPRKSDPPPAAMVPDRNWIPAPGDHAEIYGGDAPAAPTPGDFRLWFKYADANDVAGKNGLYARKAVVNLTLGTKVLVVKRLRPEPTITYIGDATDLGRAAIRESSGGRNLPKAGEFPLEVRVLDGEYKGQIRFVPEESVAKLVPAPAVKAARPAYFPKAADPAKVAATMLKSAQNLERAKKIPGALSIYRDVAKNHPGTPEAKVAAERIEALSGK